MFDPLPPYPEKGESVSEDKKIFEGEMSYANPDLMRKPVTLESMQKVVTAIRQRWEYWWLS